MVETAQVNIYARMKISDACLVDISLVRTIGVRLCIG